MSAVARPLSAQIAEAAVSNIILSAEEWLIPHVAPRHSGLITVCSLALPKNYEPELEIEADHVTYFAMLLAEEVYGKAESKAFFVPRGWLQPNEDYSVEIAAIAKSRPTLLVADRDMTNVARRYLASSRVGLVVGHNPSVASVICGDEPGWTVSVSPHGEWSLVSPWPIRVLTSCGYRQ